MKAGFTLTCLLLTTAFIASDSWGQNSEWIGGSDGLWSDSANWSNGTPNGEMNATILNGPSQITQDILDLNISGFTMDSDATNLTLDESLTISNSFVFTAGTISGGSDMTLDVGSVSTLGGSAVFFGEGANGGGTMRLSGTANIDDQFVSEGIFELSGSSGVIQGSGTLSLNNAFTWDGGIMTGSGISEINFGGLIRGGTLDRTLNAIGGIVLTGEGLTGTENAVWNNMGARAIFKISGDEGLSGPGTLNNMKDAFFKKSGGEGTSVIEWDINHEGNMILVESGVMSLRGNNFLNSQLMVLENATLDLKGTNVFGADVSHADIGTLQFSGGTARFDHEYNGDLDTVINGSAYLFGDGDIHFNRSVDIQNGTITGDGSLNFYGPTTISTAGISRITNNFAEIDLENSLISSANGNFTNRSGGQINMSGFNNAFTGAGLLSNENGASIEIVGGNNWFDWQVQNSGQINASDATVSFRDSFTQSDSGELNLDNSTVELRGKQESFEGRLSGNGTIDISDSGMVFGGNIAPGEGIDVLNFEGSVQFSAATLFDFEIGSEFTSDLISVTGDLELDGTLRISILDSIEIGTYTLFEYGGTFNDSGLQLLLPSSVKASIVNDSANRSVRINVTSIPEPSSFVVAIMALGWLAPRRRSR